jgi:hypothetical protein
MKRTLLTLIVATRVIALPRLSWVSIKAPPLTNRER